MVIGNSNYQNAEVLPNPKNDAEAIGAALERLGFEVEVASDLDQLGMLEAFRNFGLKAESAQVAVVFYAGHGIQVAGENYLLPIDARLERERDLLYEALPLNVALGEVAQADRLGLVILDACRDNPLAEKLRRALGPIRSRMVGTGLARIESLPSDTMIAFSTKPGEVAVDGSGEHSPFTAALLQHIETPGVELGLLFRKVRDTVLERTAYRQEPRTYDALGAEPFYFKVPKPNQRPELPEVAALEVLDNLGSVPLGLPPPSDPDEDRITAQVIGLPGKGTIQLGARELLIGDVLTIEQLGTLTYSPVPGEVGDAGSFDFVVKDDRGGAVIGRMPIQVARANQPPVLEVTRLLKLPAIPELREKLALTHSVRAQLVGVVPVGGGVLNGGGQEHQNGGTLLPELGPVLASQEIDRVVLAPGADGADHLLYIIRELKEKGVKVSVLPEASRVAGSSVEIDHVHGLTLLGVRRFEITRSSRLIKRGFDLLGSSLALALLAPLFAAIAVAIKLDSRGPVFFRQRRVGRDGGQLEVLKFRSMVEGAELQKEGVRHLNEGAEGLFKIAEDPRVTAVGRFLRRWQLDELPQLLNVLRGEMSLVGPRPLIPEEDRQIEGWYRRRLDVAPGITGHWQVLGSSTRVSLDEMVKLDYLYVANWSLWNDLRLLMRTVPFVLSRRGV